MTCNAACKRSGWTWPRPSLSDCQSAFGDVSLWRLVNDGYCQWGGSNRYQLRLSRGGRSVVVLRGLATPVSPCWILWTASFLCSCLIRARALLGRHLFVLSFHPCSDESVTTAPNTPPMAPVHDRVQQLLRQLHRSMLLRGAPIPPPSSPAHNSKEISALMSAPTAHAPGHFICAGMSVPCFPVMHWCCHIC